MLLVDSWKLELGTYHEGEAARGRKPIRTQRFDRGRGLLGSRSLGAQAASSTSHSLIVVGIAFGVLALVILVGVLLYLVLHYRCQPEFSRQHRHRNSVPTTSQISNGYVRTRTQSATTDGSRSKSSRKEAEPESKSFFKSWSKSAKTAYLTVPTLDANASGDLAAPNHLEQGYRYNPQFATGVPRFESKPPTRSALSFLAPSPTVNVSPRRITFPKRDPPSSPFVHLDSPRPVQHIRPRQELLVGESSLDARVKSIRGGKNTTNLRNTPPIDSPAAPSWPMESGWTHQGVSSIRDENVEYRSDSSSISDDEGIKEKDAMIDKERGALVDADVSSDDSENGQYALDKRPTNSADATFLLTPMVAQNQRATNDDRESIAEGRSLNTSPGRSRSPQPQPQSPQLDLGEDNTSHQLPTRLSDEHPNLQRGATGRFTIAFGGSSRSGRGSSARSERSTRSSARQTESTGGSRGTRRSNRSGNSGGTYGSSHSRPAPDHSRDTSATQVTRSNTGVTRSSTTRTDRTDSSTASGQILSALTARVAMPLLRSMDSLRMAAVSRAPRGGGQRSEHSDAGEHLKTDATTSNGPSTETLSVPSYTGSVRRLPPLPTASLIPPVPPIPQHHLNLLANDSPFNAQPGPSFGRPTVSTIQHPMSPLSSVDYMLPGHAHRSDIKPANRPIRALPVPPKETP